GALPPVRESKKIPRPRERVLDRREVVAAAARLEPHHPVRAVQQPHGEALRRRGPYIEDRPPVGSGRGPEQKRLLSQCGIAGMKNLLWHRAVITVKRRSRC